jgi:hypothetical protein
MFFLGRLKPALSAFHFDFTIENENHFQEELIVIENGFHFQLKVAPWGEIGADRACSFRSKQRFPMRS